MDNIDGQGTHHRLLTIALHRKLRVCDGVEITEEDRAAAAAFVQSLPEDAQEQIRDLRNWTPDMTQGEDVDEIHAAYLRKQSLQFAADRAQRCASLDT